MSIATSLATTVDSRNEDHQDEDDEGESEDETEVPSDELSESSGVGSATHISGDESDSPKKFAAPNIMDIMNQARQVEAQKVEQGKKEGEVMFGEGVTVVSYGPVGWFLICVSYLFIILLFPFSLLFCVKVCQEFERIVVFRLGRLLGQAAKGPGLVFLVPCTDTHRKVDLRIVSFDVPPQEILSKDSVTVAIDSVVYFRIRNATISVTNCEDATRSTKQLAQTTMRNILGTKTLAEMLSEREFIADEVKKSLDLATDPWGVKIDRVEIKDVRLPVQLQRAMAAEAEAAREARAKVISAEGEQKASRALREASDILSDSPSALQLRYLQTLATIATERNSTIVFPLPMDLLSGFLPHLRGGGHQCNGMKVSDEPLLPKRVRPCCVHKYPEWVQNIVSTDGNKDYTPHAPYHSPQAPVHVPHKQPYTQDQRHITYQNTGRAPVASDPNALLKKSIQNRQQQLPPPAQVRTNAIDRSSRSSSPDSLSSSVTSSMSVVSHEPVKQTAIKAKRSLSSHSLSSFSAASDHSKKASIADKPGSSHVKSARRASVNASPPPATASIMPQIAKHKPKLLPTAQVHVAKVKKTIDEPIPPDPKLSKPLTGPEIGEKSRDRPVHNAKSGRTKPPTVQKTKNEDVQLIDNNLQAAPASGRKQKKESAKLQAPPHVEIPKEPEPPAGKAKKKSIAKVEAPPVEISLEEPHDRKSKMNSTKPDSLAKEKKTPKPESKKDREVVNKPESKKSETKKPEEQAIPKKEEKTKNKKSVEGEDNPVPTGSKEETPKSKLSEFKVAEKDTDNEKKKKSVEEVATSKPAKTSEKTDKRTKEAQLKDDIAQAKAREAVKQANMLLPGGLLFGFNPNSSSAASNSPSKDTNKDKQGQKGKSKHAEKEKHRSSERDKHDSSEKEKHRSSDKEKSRQSTKRTPSKSTKRVQDPDLDHSDARDDQASDRSLKKRDRSERDKHPPRSNSRLSIDSRRSRTEDDTKLSIRHRQRSVTGRADRDDDDTGSEASQVPSDPGGSLRGKVPRSHSRVSLPAVDEVRSTSSRASSHASKTHRSKSRHSRRSESGSRRSSHHSQNAQDVFEVETVNDELGRPVSVLCYGRSMVLHGLGDDEEGTGYFEGVASTSKPQRHERDRPRQPVNYYELYDAESYQSQESVVSKASRRYDLGGDIYYAPSMQDTTSLGMVAGSDGSDSVSSMRSDPRQVVSRAVSAIDLPVSEPDDDDNSYLSVPTPDSLRRKKHRAKQHFVSDQLESRPDSLTSRESVISQASFRHDTIDYIDHVQPPMLEHENSRPSIFRHNMPRSNVALSAPLFAGYEMHESKPGIAGTPIIVNQRKSSSEKEPEPSIRRRPSLKESVPKRSSVKKTVLPDESINQEKDEETHFTNEKSSYD